MRPMTHALSHLVAADARDLAEARAESDAKSLGQRTTEAIEWLCVSVAEIARGATDQADLRARLEGEMPVSLAEIRRRNSPQT